MVGMKNNLKSGVKWIYLCLLCIGAVLVLVGCGSSKGTRADTKVTPTVQNFTPVDTTQQGLKEEMPEQSTTTESKVAPKFKSMQDTVQASIITKSKSSLSSRTEIEHTAHSVYTVQIGAYSDASNALRRQKRAKEQFPGQPIFNQYEESTQLYRVSIGMYEDPKDASALSDSLRQEYPNEYKKCWINFIP
jgi:cell division septation protein DedD